MREGTRGLIPIRPDTRIQHFDEGPRGDFYFLDRRFWRELGKDEKGAHGIIADIGVGVAHSGDEVGLGLGALTALSKSKKHFVGLTWATGDVKGGFAMQCDKNDYRGVLAGLEGVTGKKAVDSEAMTVKN